MWYNKSSFTFCDKFDNTILSATSNLWNNIQIMRTYILKYNVPNLVSLVIKLLNFETLYHHLEYAFNRIMYHVLDNVEDVKKIYFPAWKHIYYDCILKKIYQHSFLENSVCSSESLELIYSDLLELFTLSYSKYR